MNIEAMAPGVRMALKALGFEPEKIVSLMASIGTGIQSVNAELAAIRTQQDEILRRLENLENGRTELGSASLGNPASAGENPAGKESGF